MSVRELLLTTGSSGRGTRGWNTSCDSAVSGASAYAAEMDLMVCECVTVYGVW